MKHHTYTPMILLTALFLSLQLGAQQVYLFTTASNTGMVGPTQTQINAAYAATNLNNSVTVSSTGIQSFTIPCSGVYRIEARGAQGYGPYGGRGASMAGDFTLTAGTVLKILVGQEGIPPTGGTNQYGGGGGSFITDINNAPFVVAGGGGGSWATAYTSTTDGTISTTGNTGANGPSNGSGGTNGSGGLAAGSANGGAGLTGNGGGSSPAMAFINGGAGGGSTGRGGFGGGGGASSQNNRRGGGGGGYSGGGGAGSTTTGNPEGGGGGSFNGGSNQANFSGANYGPGSVTITHVDAVTIYASGSSSTAPHICSGTTLTLTTNAVSNYSWSTSSTSSSIVITPTATTVYTLSATNAAGCSSTHTLNVQVSQGLPVLSLTATPANVCLGDSVTLTASGATTYTWSTGLPNGSGFAPSGTASYSVTGQNACGTSTSAITVSATPLQVLLSSATPTVCSLVPALITASGANTYTWSTAQTGSAVSVAPSVTTTYTVDASAGNCIGSNTITIYTKPNPTLNVSGTASVICVGESVTITVSGADTYTWNPSTFSGTSIVVSPTVPTMYQVSGTNSVGCTSGSGHVVLPSPLPTLAVSASPNYICAGGTSTISVSGADTYTWNTGASGSSLSTSLSAFATFTVSGTDTVTTCKNSTTVSVNVFQPSISISSSQTVCPGTVLTLTMGGGTDPLWSNGGTFSQITVTVSGSAMYSVSANTTSNNLTCAASNSVQLNVHPKPTVTAMVNRSEACRGESVTITAGGAGSYAWTNVPTSQATNTVVKVSSNLISTQTYSVVGTNQEGCSDTSGVSVKFNVCTGIDELNSAAAPLVYPNPNNGSFTIKGMSAGEVHVLNSLGQVLHSARLDEENGFSATVSGLPQGIYFVAGEGGSITTKVVVR